MKRFLETVSTPVGPTLSAPLLHEVERRLVARLRRPDLEADYRRLVTTDLATVREWIAAKAA